MIDRAARSELAGKPLPPGCIGYDCEGRIIKEGNTVEVVTDDERRKRLNGYEFCSRGHRGKASRHFSFPGGWFVTVDFEGHQPVGCVDYTLRLISA